jgi:hypothetical protein
MCCSSSQSSRTLLKGWLCWKLHQSSYLRRCSEINTVMALNSQTAEPVDFAYTARHWVTGFGGNNTRAVPCVLCGLDMRLLYLQHTANPKICIQQGSCAGGCCCCGRCCCCRSCRPQISIATSSSCSTPAAAAGLTAGTGNRPHLHHEPVHAAAS